MPTMTPKKPQKVLPTEIPSETKNPCGCGTCSPLRIHHWFCDGCGRGPFRFQPSDPGQTYPAMKPMMVRTKSAFNAEKNKWEYFARYSCSKSCVSQEQGVITNELIELAGKRPDLAPAISSEVEVQRAARKTEQDGGAYTPGVDDL